MANHLLNPLNPSVVPSFDEAVRRERWLNERGSSGQLLGAVGAALAQGQVPLASVWAELDPTGAEESQRNGDAEREATRLRLVREQIDGEEAAWLSERILRDGSIDENERALLTFLRKEALHIDPALEPVLKKAGI